MASFEWLTLGSVMVTVILAIAPWAGMVHARLAVLTAQVASLEGKLEKLLRAYEEGLPRSAVWEARLASVERQLAELAHRLDP
jgi:uncharacterized protein involved in exopolysaccharide biosynthesis